MLYARAEGQHEFGIPARSYALASRLLADAVDEAGADRVLQAAAEREGERQGRAEAGADGADLDALEAALERRGYEPERDGDVLCSRNCPFHELALGNPPVICIARMLAPLDSPQMRGFVDGLEPINALADGSPGFVWRLQTEAGDATAIRPYDDDRIMVNLSVWRSLPALWEFVYISRHLDLMRRRREWFERINVYMALWWVPAGTLPTVDEAKRRLDLLSRDGPGPDVFTFRAPWPPP